MTTCTCDNNSQQQSNRQQQSRPAHMFMSLCDDALACVPNPKTLNPKEQSRIPTSGPPYQRISTRHTCARAAATPPSPSLSLCHYTCERAAAPHALRCRHPRAYRAGHTEHPHHYLPTPQRAPPARPRARSEQRHAGPRRVSACPCRAATNPTTTHHPDPCPAPGPGCSCVPRSTAGGGVRASCLTTVGRLGG